MLSSDPNSAAGLSCQLPSRLRPTSSSLFNLLAPQPQPPSPTAPQRPLQNLTVATLRQTLCAPSCRPQAQPRETRAFLRRLGQLLRLALLRMHLQGRSLTTTSQPVVPSRRLWDLKVTAVQQQHLPSTRGRPRPLPQPSPLLRPRLLLEIHLVTLPFPPGLLLRPLGHRRLLLPQGQTDRPWVCRLDLPTATVRLRRSHPLKFLRPHSAVTLLLPNLSDARHLLPLILVRARREGQLRRTDVDLAGPTLSKAPARSSPAAREIATLVDRRPRRSELRGSSESGWRTLASADGTTGMTVSACREKTVISEGRITTLAIRTLFETVEGRRETLEIETTAGVTRAEILAAAGTTGIETATRGIRSALDEKRCVLSILTDLLRQRC